VEQRISRAGLDSAGRVGASAGLGASGRLVPPTRLRATAKLGGAMCRSAFRSVPPGSVRIAAPDLR
jgi:hypothetical protein